jgi:hypothetical protein
MQQRLHLAATGSFSLPSFFGFVTDTSFLLHKQLEFLRAPYDVSYVEVLWCIYGFLFVILALLSGNVASTADKHYPYPRQV